MNQDIFKALKVWLMLGDLIEENLKTNKPLKKDLKKLGSKLIKDK